MWGEVIPLNLPAGRQVDRSEYLLVTTMIRIIVVRIFSRKIPRATGVALGGRQNYEIKLQRDGSTR